MDRLTTLAAIALRDGHTCYICHQDHDPHDPWEIEHVKPRAHGGTDDLENLALAHRSCNRTKGINAVIRTGNATNVPQLPHKAQERLTKWPCHGSDWTPDYPITPRF
jgi:5-methylcytosine-specific restriction endonuclease McrA